jgi:hypothetical protein
VVRFKKRVLYLQEKSPFYLMDRKLAGPPRACEDDVEKNKS